MAVDRNKFVKLRGFNRLFAPAYCEDVDLCFRAWRRGWRCIYEPRSVVWHRHQGTWSHDSNDSLNSLELRNLLLMQWSTFPMHKGRWARLRSLVKLFIGSHNETLFRPFDRVGVLVAVGAAVCGAVAVAVDVADAVAGAVGRGVAVAVAVIVAVARSRARSNCADG